MGREIDPDEIFLDSSNLPQFNTHQFEGRIEKPIGRSMFLAVGIFFVLLVVIFVSKLWTLQITNGAEYNYLSQNNSLRHTIVFANRGVIADRNDIALVKSATLSYKDDFSKRIYPETEGMSLLLGYVNYPSKDDSGLYYNLDYVGKEGVEKTYNEHLTGKNGIRIIEVNAHNEIQSSSTYFPPEDGNKLNLSIDSKVQSQLYKYISNLSDEIGFEGGTGAIMDINSGELLALTSFPEYKAGVLSDGDDNKLIQSYIDDKRKLFLNRAISGLYTPGSIVKPFLALGALTEGIIDPQKEILSTGSISIPNPFDPKKPSIFTDWKAHGYVDMRHALAVSSNVYFYEIGGGFQSQKGLGIERIEKYLRLFGLGEKMPDEFLQAKSGVIPNPEWKKLNFDGEQWRIGDTYNTSIGQYGVQVTPLQALRAVSAIANNGYLVNPTLSKKNISQSLPQGVELPFTKENIKVIKEGMRLGVTEGTAKGLYLPNISIAAKTGTAELGSVKKYVNSWVIGFFPYEAPKYAFVVLMEKGPHNNTIGGLYVMRQILEWMSVNTPEYIF
jgi:penicillin-binding protein 2